MKYFLTAVISALIVGFAVVAYYQGWLPTLNFNKPHAVSVQNTEVSNSNSVAPTPPAFTTVKAGGILVFKAYSVDVPPDWQYSTVGSSAGQIDKLTLTNGDYKIVFTQAAMGGGACIYPGDKDLGMSVKFNGFNEVTTATGERLRVGVLPSGGRAACEIQNNTWGDLTEFGHIDITNPSTPDQKFLDQINSILSSIKKIGNNQVDSNQSILDAVKAALVVKRGSDFSGFNYSLNKVEGNYASGTVNGTGGGGMWFAAKVSGSWVIVWDGNGSILCSDLTPYPNFPKDMVPQCWDPSTNQSVIR